MPHVLPLGLGRGPRLATFTVLLLVASGLTPAGSPLEAKPLACPGQGWLEQRWERSPVGRELILFKASRGSGERSPSLREFRRGTLAEGMQDALIGRNPRLGLRPLPCSLPCPCSQEAWPSSLLQCQPAHPSSLCFHGPCRNSDPIGSWLGTVMAPLCRLCQGPSLC